MRVDYTPLKSIVSEEVLKVRFELTAVVLDARLCNEPKVEISQPFFVKSRLKNIWASQNKL